MSTVLCVGTGWAQSSNPAREADAAMRVGSAAMAENNLDAARVGFEKAVRLEPSAEIAHSALGAVLLRQGHSAEGIAELQQALALKPSDTVAQLNLANAFVQAHHPERALPWFAKYESAMAVARKPVLPAVLAMHAGALAQAGHTDAAIEKFQLLVAQFPDNAVYRDNLGSLLAQQAKWPAAEEQFRRAVAIDDTSPMAHLHLGMAMKAQQQAGATAELQEAFRLAPDNALIAQHTGAALADDGNDEVAVPILRHALEIDPNSAETNYRLGLLLENSQPDSALPLLEKAASTTDASPEMLANYGMALCQAQRAGDALAPLHRALSLDPHSITAREDLAIADIQLNKLGDAADILTSALKDAPDSPTLHYNLGFVYKAEDQPAKAEPEFVAAAHLNPAAPEPHYALGLVYRLLGRNAEASDELSASLKLRPQNGDAWESLGSIYNDLNRLPEATDALNKAIQQLPGKPEPHLTLAAVLTKQGKTEEAKAERHEAAGLMHASMDRQRAEVASNTAASMLKNGRTNDAVAQYREALSFDQGYAPAHLGLADALQKQGDSSEAAVERQRGNSLEGKP